MSFILYYLIIKPLSLVPLSITYIFSDILYFFVYHLGGYRTKIVTKNITSSFPDKSPAEIRQIIQQFYRHFCDILVESLHFFSISEAELRQRFEVKNPEIVEAFYEKQQNIVMMGAHYHNWELVALASNLLQNHQAVGVYRPLSDKFFDKKMRQNRSKFGLELVTKWELIKVFKRKNTIPVAVMIMADQAPTNDKKRYWTRFLNQDTAMITGTEQFARMYDFPVIYTRIHKLKRGHYQAVHEVLETNPTQTQAGEITEKYARILEKDILNAPQFWLWTHRRWKQKRLDAALYKIQKVK